MSEIRLNIGSLWDIKSNVKADINSINWYIANIENAKVIVNLPISYIDSSILNEISNLDKVEFETSDGRRFKSHDIIITNQKLKNMADGIKNSILSPFEKFIVIYSTVTNYKPYKEGNPLYLEIGRCPYLFINDEYINCVGICQLLCILGRLTGINVTMLADEASEHAICYVYIKDDKYKIDGYFSSDPTIDTKSEKNLESQFYNMIRRITTRNDFEKFLNSNIELSYPVDLVNIGLFSKYILFLQTSDFLIESNDNELSLIDGFREKFRKKQFDIDFDVICTAVSQVESLGFIPLIKDKDLLKNTLFIQQVEDKMLMRESTEYLISRFIASSTGKKL